MGTLQQQSVLKGLQIDAGKEEEKEALLHKLFSQVAAKYSGRVAIYHEGDNGEEHIISYQELDSLTNRLARALRKYDKFDNDSQPFVAVCMKPSQLLPTVLLAIVKAGMAYLPLDAEFPMSRVKHVLQEAEPLMVLVEEGGKEPSKRRRQNQEVPSGSSGTPSMV